MKKGIKIAAGAVVVIGVLALVLQRMMQPAEVVQTKSLPTVTLTRMSQGSIANSISLMGTIEPSDTYAVMPKVAGEVLECYVENGQFVHKGDPIVKLDNQKQIDAAKYTLEQANVSATTARDALSRMTPLYEAGDISAQDYESTKAQADAAEAQAASAKLNYDTQVEYATVTAPADGTIENKNITINAMVSQQSQLCILTGSGAKTLQFNVTEDVMENLELGETVTVEKNGGTYEGTVTEIGHVVNAQTGLFPVKAELSAAETLADGSSAKLTVVNEHAENVSLLPLDCLYYSNGNPYVYVYEDGLVHKKDLTLGIQNEESAQILSGINAGDQVVQSWTNELYDGASVNIASEAASGDPMAKPSLTPEATGGPESTTSTETAASGDPEATSSTEAETAA